MVELDRHEGEKAKERLKLKPEHLMPEKIKPGRKQGKKGGK